ncbi:MAG: glycosyltransferase family 2 protein [Eubacteriales bacterium]|jgi:dolichol-phosphate mannosyltransferase|nr:glycosyltransferase family 2 protein [Lachnospiraceae bacterium]MDD5858839.1 glycosyltransferase family 2 protein [Eubacteriales bacterium]MCH4064776.1 glycosyltransferase family 2 protein [Lachnospiraceae bacterium]MCH4103751.1 glycosyltransferase family 2 protein [Lachnospiraceae bacterium]MCI1308264.1 glycosyltransferase family 2 protein [Lachnospiraceae bacterium]
MNQDKRTPTYSAEEPDRAVSEGFMQPSLRSGRTETDRATDGDFVRDGVLTVVVPAFNEEDNIAYAADRIGRALTDAGIRHEIVFVDDGSSDGTWDKIRTCTAQNSAVRGLHFSRNFGKEGAVFAGLMNCETECLAVIDCDMQQPPEKLPEMFALWRQGVDVIEGVKYSRGQENAAHRGAASLFYRFVSKASGFSLEDTSDYKLLDREVVTVLKHLPERNTFFRAMSFWVGFRSAEVGYEVEERKAGRTKWTPAKLGRYALDSISSFTTAPMQIVTWLGFLMLAVAVIFGVTALVQKIQGVALGGFTTVILLQLFIGAIIMISLGIIGFYIARIYTEAQHRPRFIVSEACGFGKEHVARMG